jgi:predicted nuclease of predicted toxin-antitoxin system
MKIKLDENIPAILASLLSGLGHDADTVPREGLAGKSDQDVWHTSQQAGDFLSHKTWIFQTSDDSLPAPTTAFCWCGGRPVAEPVN